MLETSSSMARKMRPAHLGTLVLSATTAVRALGHALGLDQVWRPTLPPIAQRRHDKLRRRLTPMALTRVSRAMRLPLGPQDLIDELSTYTGTNLDC
jgi:hypothetical protein